MTTTHWIELYFAVGIAFAAFVFILTAGSTIIRRDAVELAAIVLAWPLCLLALFCKVILMFF